MDCKNCKHFNPLNKEEYYSYHPKFGECKLNRFNDERLNFNEIQEDTKIDSSKMYSLSEWGDDAMTIVGEDFGCKLFEAKKNE